MSDLSSRESAPAEPYLPGLDWLRFALASLVMLSHFKLFPWWPHIGGMAVEVFFALSGWLIGGILLRLDRRQLPQFYFNRAMRIWVPYYLALGLLVVVSLTRDPITAKWLEFVAYKLTFVWNLFGTQQLATAAMDMPLKGSGNHFWSVNAEEQFYLLAPVVLVLAASSFGRRWWTWLAIACLCVATDVYGSIVMGVLAAVVDGKTGGALRTGRARAWSCLLIVIAAAGLLTFADDRFVKPFFAIGIVLALTRPGVQTPLGKFVGGLSYPLYLNHWIGTFVSSAVLKPLGLKGSAIQGPVSVIFAIAIASGLYWFVDRRLLQRRAALYTPSRGRALQYAGFVIVACGVGLGWTLLAGAPR